MFAYNDLLFFQLRSQRRSRCIMGKVCITGDNGAIKNESKEEKR